MCGHLVMHPFGPGPTLSCLQSRKLVFTTVDRAVSYYEANRGLYELSGRVYASGSMGVPQTLTLVTNDAGGWVTGPVRSPDSGGAGHA